MTDISIGDPKAVALATAIRAGRVDDLRNLLRDDATLATARIVDEKGVARTLLHLATDFPGHFPNGPEIVAVLAAAGADLNAAVAGSVGSAETPLHWAASCDDVEVIDALLDAGASVEAPGAVFTGGPAMSDAVVFAQWRAARRLLERGATTTIWQAAALGLVDRVRELCSRDPTPSPRDLTNACWHACRGGQQATVELLVDRGADLNWIGHDHKTPLDVAEESGAEGLVDWLQARGARRAAAVTGLGLPLGPAPGGTV